MFVIKNDKIQVYLEISIYLIFIDNISTLILHVVSLQIVPIGKCRFIRFLSENHFSIIFNIFIYIDFIS